MSKLVSEDVPLFLSLIEDLFPDITAERTALNVIESAIFQVQWFLLTSARYNTFSRDAT